MPIREVYPSKLKTFYDEPTSNKKLNKFKAEKNMQNQVWVGMSKETAHQLGTPLTSIYAWMELLKEKEENLPYINEMENDVQRLQLIAWF